MSLATNSTGAASGVAPTAGSARSLLSGTAAARDLETKGVMKSSRSSALDATSSVSDYIQQMVDLQNSNNAWSASQAAIQRSWQESQNKLAMDFNASEAAKNRDWQKMMSDTAHQREIRDLQAAGLNPVLSVMGGNGAPVGSGATASGVTSAGAKGDTDVSASQAIAGLISAVWQQETQLEIARTTAQNNMAIAEKQNATSELVAQLAGLFGNERAEISGRYGLAGSQLSHDASELASLLAFAASVYGTDVSSQTALDVQKMKGEQEDYIKKNYPQGIFGSLASLGAKFKDLLNLGSGSGLGTAGGSSGLYNGSDPSKVGNNWYNTYLRKYRGSKYS